VISIVLALLGLWLGCVWIVATTEDGHEEFAGIVYAVKNAVGRVWRMFRAQS
jgi:hypothetical protein